MEHASTEKKPEILVFAGPNGSGKTTVTRLATLVGVYVNADEVKNALNCSALEAAQIAEKQRETLLSERANFTFETVLSTDRNLLLLKRAKESGYFVRCVYVLTDNASINIDRVHIRHCCGGHDVPEDKIVSRYEKALKLIPELVPVCDIMHIYDNTIEPFRIFKKRKNIYMYWENPFWNRSRIEDLTGVTLK